MQKSQARNQVTKKLNSTLSVVTIFLLTSIFNPVQNLFIDQIYLCHLVIIRKHGLTDGLSPTRERIIAFLQAFRAQNFFLLKKRNIFLHNINGLILTINGRLIKQLQELILSN